MEGSLGGETLSRSEVGIQNFSQTEQTAICSIRHLVSLLVSSYRSHYNNAPILIPHRMHSFFISYGAGPVKADNCSGDRQPKTEGRSAVSPLRFG